MKIYRVKSKHKQNCLICNEPITPDGPDLYAVMEYVRIDGNQVVERYHNGCHGAREMIRDEEYENKTKSIDEI